MHDQTRDSLQAALGSAYTVQRELGGGGMSRVWLARDEALERSVVVKLLAPELAQEFSVERFTREIRLAAVLQHAHIVPLLSAGATTDGLPYYLMPFVEGDSLRGRLEQSDARNGLPIDEVVLVLQDVARALAYAHQRGVVHRDIKPDNVMLSGGAAVVTDFGIAKAVSSARAAAADTDAAGTESLTRMGTSLGTPSYMAPEQGAGDPATDHRADVYAFGVMAYEMLTGSTPFGARPAHALLVAHFTEIPVHVTERRADVPQALADLVMQCMAKDPDQRPQSAAAIVAALKDGNATGSTASRTAAAANATNSAPPQASDRVRNGRRTRVLLGGALLVAAVAATLWYTMLRAPAVKGLDSSLVAVMPFNVRDSTLSVWREGLVDMLSRSLDGAGPLRTVAASTSIGNSPARADAASAAELGRALGAGLVVFGDLTPVGRDSVHMRLAVFDVATGRTRSDVDLRGDATHMDAMADSLSLRILREIGVTGGQGGPGLYTVGTRSLPALKAFLQGQQFYRRAVSDSAREAYLAALRIDSTFALAWRGVAAIYIRTGRENDPEAQRALEMAIRYKAGRSPRDSMLLRADSLRLVVARRAPVANDALAAVPALSLLFDTFARATQQYPSDAELWFEAGDAAFHFGHLADVSQERSLASFERGIALDSTFVVSYFHALDLALRGGRAADAARYARRAAALYGGEAAPYYRLLAAVLDSQPLSRTARLHVDSASAPYLAGVLAVLAPVPDSGASALALVASLEQRPARMQSAADSNAIREAMLLAYATRGRIGRARALLTATTSPTTQVALARLGAIPMVDVLDRARRALTGGAPGGPQRAAPAARQFADASDTVSLATLARWADSSAASADPARARSASAVGDVLRGYVSLARGDSARALRELLSAPMAACGGAPCAGGTVARLLAAAGRHAEAAMVLDRWLPSVNANAATPLDLLFRAELAERLGDDERASMAYRRVLALWGAGDASVRASVEQATAGLARVGKR